MKTENRRVAVLIPTSSQWGRGVIEGIHSYVQEKSSWQIFVEARSETEILKIPEGWKGEGIIARVQSNKMATDLKRTGIPVVNVSRIRLRDAHFPSVSTDLPSVAKIAAEHFLDRGFKHFAYFVLKKFNYVTDHQRAFVNFLEKLGYQCTIYTSNSGNDPQSDWNVDMTDLADWLKSLPKPIGIFTWNASSGRQLLHGAEWANLNVPEEIALLSGVDDNLLCELPSMPISGIAAAAKQIGYEAAELLDKLMSGKQLLNKMTTIPPVGVVTRQSTDTLAIPDKSLVKAVRFIRENAGRPINVQDVLDQVPVSRRSLERMFSRTLKRSPSEEIRRVHFERAKFLLTHTDQLEPDVAAAAGYGSPEYMIHVFKTRLGMSPMKYRKHIKNR